MEKNRLDAFSDGVLAIIITIMILEIKIPHGSDWTNITGLLPIFLSYVISFLYVGIYWGNHHHLLNTTKKINSQIMLANLNLLFWLSLIPFTTGWMGENQFQANTIALYSLNLLITGIAYFILQKSIERRHMQSDDLKFAMKKHGQKGIISQIAYLLAIPLAYIQPILSLAIFIIIAIIWLIPDKEIENALDQ